MRTATACSFLSLAITWVLPGLAAAQAVERLPLRVVEKDSPTRDDFAHGATRHLGVGVALPIGRMTDPDLIGIEASGTPLARQVHVRTTWPDGSIRWAWAHFESPTHKGLEVALHSSPTTHPAPNLPVLAHAIIGSGSAGPALTSGPIAANRFEVNTGPLRVRFHRANAAPRQVEILSSQQVLRGGSIRATHADGLVETLAGQLTWHLEEAGPVRVVLRVEGDYIGGPSRSLRAVMRYFFTSGSPVMRIEHTLVIARHTHTNPLVLREISIEMPWEAHASMTAFYADADGAHQSRDLAAPAIAAQVKSPVFTDQESHVLLGSTATDPSPIDGRLESYVLANAPGARAFVLCPDLAEQFPKSLRVTQRRLAVDLWSSRATHFLDYRLETVGQHYLEPWFEDAASLGYTPPSTAGYAGLDATSPFSALGCARTHEVSFAYYSAATPTTTVLAEAQALDARPIVLLEPSNLLASGVFGELHPKDPNTYPELEQCIEDYLERFLELHEGFPQTGWYWWGMAPYIRYDRLPNGQPIAEPFRMNKYARYRLAPHVWLSWIRSADREFYELAKNLSRFVSDTQILHLGEPGVAMGRRAGLLSIDSQDGILAPWKVQAMGRWETGGTTSDTITPLMYAYFLDDARWAKDSIDLYAQAVVDQQGRIFQNPIDWSQSARLAVDSVAGFAQMLGAYEALGPDTPTLKTQLRAVIDEFADRLLDPAAEFGISDATTEDGGVWQWRYNQDPAVPVAVQKRGWANYKIDHKLVAILDYYRITGDARAQQSFLAACEDGYSLFADRDSLGSQNLGGYVYAKAYQWTSNPLYLSLAEAHIRAACFELAQERAAGTWPGQVNASTQMIAFHAIPRYLAVIDGAGRPTVPPHPVATVQVDRISERPLLLVEKLDQQELTVRFQIRNSVAPPTVTMAHIDGTSVTPSLTTGFTPTPYVPSGTVYGDYTIALAANEPAGIYRIDIDHDQITVTDSSSPKIALEQPRSFYIWYGAQESPLASGLPYTFRKSTGLNSVRVLDARSVAFQDAQGNTFLNHTGGAGAWRTVSLAPVNDGDLVSFLPLGLPTKMFPTTYSNPVVIALGDPSRLIDLP